jgi:hypothetical protein
MIAKKYRLDESLIVPISQDDDDKIWNEKTTIKNLVR